MKPKHPIVGNGKLKLAYIKFTPNGSSAPTVAKAEGFSSTVTRSNTGIYVCTIDPVVKDIVVDQLSAVPGDSNYHELVYAVSVANRTVTITHRTVAYANIVSAGPAASDTCGQITLAVLVPEAG